MTSGPTDAPRSEEPSMIDRPSRIVGGLAFLVGMAAVGLRGAYAEPEPREGRLLEPVRGSDRLEALERRVAELERRLEIPTRTRRRDVAAPHLEGRWLMTLPAGFEHRVALDAAGTDRYRLRAIRLDSHGEGD